MGSVYAGRNAKDGRVAVKIMRNEQGRSVSEVQRFMREAVLQQSLNHPSIAKAIDVGVHHGSPWIAMELLVGETLATRLMRGPIPWSDLVPLIVQVLDGLAVAHSHDVVHRDLKPANIFLVSSPEGVKAKLLDFGIAKLSADLLSTDRQLTKTGHLLGTPLYLPIEQAKSSRDVDARADIYSVGVIMFEALAGRRPFEGANLTEYISKLLVDSHPDLQKLAPSVPRPLVDVVHRCLSQDPSMRPRDAAALRKELVSAVDASNNRGTHADTIDELAPTGVSAPIPTTRDGEIDVGHFLRRETRNRRGSRGIAALGVAVLVAVGLVAWTQLTVPGQPGAAVDQTPDSGATSSDAFAPVVDPVAELALGRYHSCARRTSGTVACWGDNSSGQLGDGTTESKNLPTIVSGISTAVELGLGDGFTCARLASGRVLCWGRNDFGQLGNGTTRFSLRPSSVSEISDVTSLALGGNHACAVSAGRVWCWGGNEHGQLGMGTTAGSPVPVEVSGLDGVNRVVAGGIEGCEMSCAIRDGGRLSCWGCNNLGQICDGTASDRWSPVEIDASAGAVLDSSPGGSFQCVVRADHVVSCCGHNRYGALGDGTTTTRNTLAPVDLSNVVEISSGLTFACARRVQGDVSCWGFNRDGQVGDGTTDYRLVPTRVRGLSDVAEVEAGGLHACARRANGEVVCWGSNSSGAVGDGTTDDRFAPVVVFPAP